MKYLIFGVCVLLAMASCRKSSGIKPVTPIDTDAVIHHITLLAPAQFAATKVKGDTLDVIYYENITLFIPSNGLNLSYSLHLKEDFSSSSLLGYNFTTIDAYGDVTYDWVDDNLNNVIAKTEKDTVINSAKVTEITVQRPFTFFKTFPNATAAIAVQDSLLARKTDKMIISSNVYFTKVYPATETSIALYYIKID